MLLGCGNVQADRLDSLYQAIDHEISHADENLAKKLQTLTNLRRETNEAKTPLQRYELTLQLYEAYRSFRNDSAIACLNQAIALSQTLGREDLKAACYTKMGIQHSTSGSYNEAMHYLTSIPRDQLKGTVLTDYYYGMNHLYGEMASYTQDEPLRWQYYSLSARYRDSLLQHIPADSEMALDKRESQLYNDHLYEQAMTVNDQRMQFVKPGTHDYAIVTYFRAMDYAALGNTEEQKYWLAQSALCDIKNAVMDQASLWSLADVLNHEGDIDRSYRYVEYSWACTSRFSAHVRSWLVAPVLTMINSGYKAELNKSNHRLWILVGAVTLLALLMAGMYLYVSRKRQQLTIARNELRQANHDLTQANGRLSELNSELSTLNGQLSTLNVQLSESNRIKEEYIGKFLSICSGYIDKLEQFRLEVNSKMKAHKLDELFRMSQNEEMKEDELADLYANFDSVFIHLFPNFVDEFNALLKPEHRIQQPDKSKLPTDIRIFALIRLGIDDSSRIAEFLRYSPNTIYNYRARLKSKAVAGRDNFEATVRQLGR